MRNTTALDLELIENRFLDRRTAYMAEHIGTTDPKENLETAKQAFRRLNRNTDGSLKLFEQSQKDIQNLLSAVLTGHPCTSMTWEMAQALSKQFNALAKGEKPKAEWHINPELNRNFQDPTLNSEREMAHDVMPAVHEAIRMLERVVIEVAMEDYPDQWMSGTYTPLGQATWLPFDWDGRDDVHWATLMEEAIYLQITMLDQHMADFGALAEKLTGDNKSRLEGVISKLHETVEKLYEHHRFFKNYPDLQDGNFQNLADHIDKMSADIAARIIKPAELIAPLDEIIAGAEQYSTDVQRDLVHLRSRIHGHGLSQAKIHFRLSSKSVKSDLNDNGIDTGEMEGETLDNVIRPKIQAMMKQTKPVDSNLIDAAQTDKFLAKQMIAIRQIVDHFGPQPIRFLIAESDNASVVLAALMNAKKYGVEDHIEISPLFEDRGGIENAERMVKTLFKDKNYRDYIKKHGVACFQFGFSDSGRYDGQLAAGAFMEQVEGFILKEAKKYSLTVDICCFKTGGKFAGRGSHPESMTRHYQYLETSYALADARKKGLHLRTETSWQGLDGWLWLMEPDTALATLTRGLHHLTADHDAALKDDPYYIKDASGGMQEQVLAFFEDARAAHAQLSGSDSYAAIVDINKNKLRKTGSRPVKRVASSGGARKLTRAIQNNGIMRLLGMKVPEFYGAGAAIHENPETFLRGIKKSEVFRMRMEIVERAVAQSDPDQFRKNLQLLSPQYWLDASKDCDGEQAEKIIAFAEELESLGLYNEMRQAAIKIEAEHKRIKNLYLLHGLQDRINRYEPDIFEKRDLNKLNAEMHNEIHNIFLKILDVPAPPSQDQSLSSIRENLLRLDPMVLADLKKIFGTHSNDNHVVQPQSKPSGLTARDTDYARVHDNVLVPIGQSMDRIKDISAMIMHSHTPGVG